MLPLAIAGATLAGGSILGGLLNRGGGGAPNIEGELAKISALFQAQRDATTQAINSDAGRARGLSASNLATRGTYTSPVSEHTFGEIDRNRVNSLASALAQIGVNEAGVRGSLLSQMLGMTDQANQRRSAGDAAMFGQIGGFGSSLLLSSLLGPPAPSVPGSATRVMSPATSSMARNIYAQAFR